MSMNRFRLFARLTAACIPIICFAGTQAKVGLDFGKVPLSFEANRGQSDARVDYLSRGKGYTLLLTRGQAVLRLQTAARSSVLLMRLLGSSGQGAASGLDRLPGSVNYFRGQDPSKWHTGIPTYQKVKYTGVYPGVDVVYYGNQGRLEHDFIVEPGADPSQIALSFEGAQPRIDRQGDLFMTIDGSELRFQKPAVYQASNQASGRGKQSVDGRYALDGNTVRFALGAYDRSRELVIDPLLVYSSYLGGTGYDYGNGIAVDSQGSAYVTGFTASTDFPTQNSIFPTSNGTGASYEAFVAKFNTSGTALIYSTYLGGATPGQSVTNDIAVDPRFNAYVGGITNANDFPITGGAFQTLCAAEIDGSGNRVAGCGASDQTSAFLTKIDPAGSALVYSTYLGGTNSSTITAVAVDSAGEAYVAGYTVSTCGSDQPTYFCFPTTSGALLPGSWLTGTHSSTDAFFTKFDAAGATLLYSTLYGTLTPADVSHNQNPTNGSAIAIDANGDAYITGWTIDGNLPVTSGAFQTSASPLIGGTGNSLIAGRRAFVAKFDPTQSGQSSLIYGSYLGGTGGSGGNAADQATGIAVDSGGSAYLTGSAGSPNFPTTPRAYQRTCYSDGGVECSTAFVTKLNPAGSALVYSTMLGRPADGSGSTVTAMRIRVNSTGDAFVTGNTGNGFPLVNPIATSGTGFVTEVNPNGRALLFSTYVPGAYVQPTSLALDGQGSVYLTGLTASGLTVTTGAFQQTFGGYYDAFATKIASVASDVQVTNAAPTNVRTGADLTYTITAGNNGPDAAGKVVVSDTLPTGTTFVSVSTSAGTCTSPAVGGTGAVRCTIGGLAVSATATVTLTVNVNAVRGTILTDTANISAAAYDPNTANNHSTVRTYVTK